MAGKHSPRHAAPSKPSRSRTENAYTAPVYEQEEQEYIEQPRPKKRKKKTPVWKLILMDIALAGVILCVFAIFHHVIPRMTANKTEAPTPSAIVMPSPTPTPEVTPDVGRQPEETPVPTPEPTPDDGRTEWQRKFAEHFTDEVVVTENSYTSPEVSITINKVIVDEPSTTVCYVADIYVAQIENFQTYFATGEFGYYFSENPVNIAKNSGAIISINGDYANNQKTGLLVRNGQLYMSEQTYYDICVLYYDGTMETYAADEYKVEDVLARGPYQTWKFGPELLDENGQPKTEFNTTTEISWENPRSAVGYYEPGHYCFVMVDGRQNHSRGLDMDQLAQLFADLGCKAAYNLDGGASAVMTFDGSIYNSPSNGGRDSGDILLITEIAKPEKSTEGGEG